MSPCLESRSTIRHTQRLGKDVTVRLGNVCQKMQPVRETVSYRGLFTAGWFGVREKYCSWLKIYDRLRASEQAVSNLSFPLLSNTSYWLNG